MSQKRMVELLEKLVPEEGVIEDVIERVDLFRITQSSPRTSQKYEPSIIFLAEGSKRVYVGDDVFDYNPMNYLVLSVPLPLECEIHVNSGKPMLGFTIKVDAAVVGEILLAIDDIQQNPKSLPLGIYSSEIENDLSKACVRLLEALSLQKDKVVLGPMIVKEIIYRVLQGEKGEALRALAFRNQRFFQIARVLDKIHDSFDKKINLNALALEAGMSLSTFHASFKAVTNSSPLQYIKNVRLHKARLLMIEEGVNAYSAAFHVGYESPSQFNREYKRLFGLSPGKDVSATTSTLQ